MMFGGGAFAAFCLQRMHVVPALCGDRLGNLDKSWAACHDPPCGGLREMKTLLKELMLFFILFRRIYELHNF